jgi:hypothetical protein
VGAERLQEPADVVAYDRHGHDEPSAAVVYGLTFLLGLLLGPVLSFLVRRARATGTLTRCVAKK